MIIETPALCVDGRTRGLQEIVSFTWAEEGVCFCLGGLRVWALGFAGCG